LQFPCRTAPQRRLTCTNGDICGTFLPSNFKPPVRCGKMSGKACVTNPPIPSPTRLRCTYGVFLGNFGGWPFGATTAAVLQKFLFSRCRGAVQGTGKFELFVKIF
jgi:hypothetical protein